jgi:hypothetical protein
MQLQAQDHTADNFHSQRRPDALSNKLLQIILSIEAGEHEHALGGDEAATLSAGASCDGASRALADGAAARGTGAVRGAVTGDELGTSSRGGGGDGSRGLGGRCLRQGRGTRDEAAALAAGACGHRTSGTFADGAADRSAVRVCRARAGDELCSSSDARKNGRGRHNGD